MLQTVSLKVRQQRLIRRQEELLGFSGGKLPTKMGTSSVLFSHMHRTHTSTVSTWQGNSLRNLAWLLPILNIEYTQSSGAALEVDCKDPVSCPVSYSCYEGRKPVSHSLAQTTHRQQNTLQIGWHDLWEMAWDSATCSCIESVQVSWISVTWRVKQHVHKHWLNLRCTLLGSLQLHFQFHSAMSDFQYSLVQLKLYTSTSHHLCFASHLLVRFLFLLVLCAAFPAFAASRSHI